MRKMYLGQGLFVLGGLNAVSGLKRAKSVGRASRE